MNKKVFVGLSGGVDSAVSAALLARDGYDVTGVFIRIAIAGYPCPAAEDRLDAMRVAAHLKIPFREVDLSDEYVREVFRPSIRAYAEGHTPNPDTLCNEKIKFGAFFDYCMQSGADAVATGHYAQVKNGNLYVSADKAKDQTYFLWAVPEEKLRKTLFPVGGLQKAKVRALAKAYDLPNAERPDSQGLCFLGNIGIDEMLAREVPQQPGNVLDETGRVVGRHHGTVHYTLGERHGFELATHTPHEVPHYVIDKDMRANTITVSPHTSPVHAKGVSVRLVHSNWIGKVANGPCEARFRYRQEFIPAELVSDSLVVLHKPFYVPKGQSLVLYRGHRCLGGGMISDAKIVPC